MALQLGVGAQLGPFHLVRRLGGGGQAEVWLAKRKDSALDRLFALKIFVPRGVHDQRQIDFLLREASICAQFHTAHIVSVVDIVHVDGFICVQMEYLSGEDLGSILASCPAGMPAPLALYIIGCVLMALEVAHERRDLDGKRVIHRDIKPGNIFIGGDGHVKLMDFGIAKLVGDEGTFTVLAGTRGYFAPELYTVGGSPSPRSDLFSLGVVLFELLTGARLFRGQTEAEYVALTLQCHIPSLAELGATVSPEVEAVLRRLLARDPASRHASASEALVDVRRLSEARQAGAHELRRFAAAIRGTVSEHAPADPPVAEVAARSVTPTAGSRFYTTGARGESLHAPPPRRRPPAWVLATSGVALAVAAAIAIGAQREPAVATSAPDAAPPPAVPATGKLIVTATPRGAAVRVDGNEVDASRGVDLPRGARVHLEVVLEGHVPYTADVDIAGALVNVPVVLAAMPAVRDEVPREVQPRADPPRPVVPGRPKRGERSPLQPIVPKDSSR